MALRVGEYPARKRFDARRFENRQRLGSRTARLFCRDLLQTVQGDGFPAGQRAGALHYEAFPQQPRSVGKGYQGLDDVQYRSRGADLCPDGRVGRQYGRSIEEPQGARRRNIRIVAPERGREMEQGAE